MTNDDFFRWLVLGILLVVAPYPMSRRVRSNSGEQLDRWQEGPWILFGLRLGAVPAFVATIAWLINPRLMSWASLPLPLWLRWTGVLLLVLWGGLLAWTFYHLGDNLTDTVVTRKTHTLVTSGPYRYVRHPFYLAFFVALAGFFLVTTNWFLLAAGLIPAVFLVARTGIEERKLVERFGDEYQQYMKNTGRFWPKANASWKPD